LALFNSPGPVKGLQSTICDLIKTNPNGAVDLVTKGNLVAEGIIIRRISLELSHTEPYNSFKVVSEEDQYITVEIPNYHITHEKLRAVGRLAELMAFAANQDLHSMFFHPVKLSVNRNLALAMLLNNAVDCKGNFFADSVPRNIFKRLFSKAPELEGPVFRIIVESQMHLAPSYKWLKYFFRAVDSTRWASEMASMSSSEDESDLYPDLHAQKIHAKQYATELLPSVPTSKLTAEERKLPDYMSLPPSNRNDAAQEEGREDAMLKCATVFLARKRLRTLTFGPTLEWNVKKIISKPFKICLKYFSESAEFWTQIEEIAGKRNEFGPLMTVLKSTFTYSFMEEMRVKWMTQVLDSRQVEPRMLSRYIGILNSEKALDFGRWPGQGMDQALGRLAPLETRLNRLLHRVLRNCDGIGRLEMDALMSPNLTGQICYNGVVRYNPGKVVSIAEYFIRMAEYFLRSHFQSGYSDPERVRGIYHAIFYLLATGRKMAFTGFDFGRYNCWKVVQELAGEFLFEHELTLDEIRQLVERVEEEEGKEKI
jgi:hypothetical protein